jgi:glycosyltransferase involved in cell wall biosynthesis
LLLSIIIPTFNRWHSLQRTLGSITAQTLDTSFFEIIVVDDGSTDETRSGQNHYNHVTFLHQKNRGPAAARNAGAAAARGDILVFTDDDCTLPPQWLNQIEGLFSATECELLGGATRNVVPNFYWSTVHQSINDFWQSAINKGEGRDFFLTSNNMAVRKSAFTRIAGFDEHYNRPGGEDRDLAIRAAAAGFRVYFAADVIIDHHHQLTFREFCRQHINYGGGSFLLHIRQPDVRTERRLYLKLLSHGWNGPSIWAKIMHFSAILLSQSFIAWGFFRSAIKK